MYCIKKRNELNVKRVKAKEEEQSDGEELKGGVAKKMKQSRESLGRVGYEKETSWPLVHGKRKEEAL